MSGFMDQAKAQQAQQMEAQRQAMANMSPEERIRARKVKKMNDLSLGPVKQLPMTAFMMWMVGNDINIFPIMMTYMAISGPITSMGQVGTVFLMFENDDEKEVRGKVFMAKVTYLLCCILALGVGLLKLSWMGLMPLNYADWMDKAPPEVSQVAVRGYNSF